MSQPFYRKSPRDELVMSIIMPDSPKKQQKIQPVLRQNSVRKQAQEVPTVAELNNQSYLYDELERSYKLVSYPERQMIQQHQTLVQAKVHDIESGQNEHKVLSNVFKMSAANPYIENEIMKVVSKAEQKVSKAISHNIKPKKQIPLTKDDLRQLQKVDKYRLLKIKNGQIKQKIGDLRQQLQQQYYHKKANYKLPQHQNVKQSDYYSIENPRTQQANQFIHKIQQQRNQEKKKYRDYLMKKQEEQNMRKSMEAERKKNEAEQRKIRFQEIYHQKLMKRKQQQEQNFKKKEDIKEWSKIFQKQKPLYVRKQQQFIENQLIPQIYNRRQKLFEIKMARRPIDLADINDHDQRYMEYKKDDYIRQQAQLQIQRERQRANQEDLQHLYKGKYRYIALQEMINQKMRHSMDPRDVQRQKKAKQSEYAEQIKQKMMEQIKLKQLQTLNLQKKQFTKRKRNIDGTTSFDVSDSAKMTSKTDPKADGKRNLYFMKQLVRQKGVRNDKPVIKLVGQRNVYPDYLHEGAQSRRKSLNMNMSSILDETNSSVQGSPNIDSLIAIERRLDDQVKRSDMRKKFKSLDYRNDASIQQDQINAAKMKLKLINQLN